MRGVRLELGPHVTPALREEIYRERYERREARCLSRILRPTDTVMEIGAGMGFLSTLAALRIGADRVFAFEANPMMIDVIRHTYQLNGVRPTLTHGVLGRGDGTVEFYAEQEFVASSLIRGSASAQQFQVPQLDVTREMERIRPTVMAIDVEGAERELVGLISWVGVEKVIIDLHPLVIGEDGVQTVLSMLREAGFVADRWLSSTNKKLLIRR